jgi:ABC-type amino acid transport substrate-binding protein
VLTVNTFGASFVFQCQALAAAVFGTTNVTNRYVAIPVTTLDRFTSLQSGDVDVLVGFTTHNMERQILEVRDFMMIQPVMFTLLSKLAMRTSPQTFPAEYNRNAVCI